MEILEQSVRMTLNDIDSFLPAPFFDDLCASDLCPVWPWKPEDPLLIVQATKFTCGGLALGVSFNHLICDGASFWHFMVSWGEIARNGRIGVPPQITFDLRISELEQDFTDKHVGKRGFVLGNHEKIRQAFMSGHHFREIGDLAYMTLSSKALRRLKSHIPNHSSFEAISAFIWKVLASISDHENDYPTTFAVLMNARNKLKKASETYFGNAIFVVPVHSTIGNVKQASMSQLATSVHMEVSQMTTEKLETLTKYFYEMEEQHEFPWIPQTHQGDFIIVVSSPRHPIYQTDFGWGTPIQMSMGTNDFGDHKVFLFPSRIEGDIEIMVALKKPKIEKFTRRAMALLQKGG